MTARVAVASEYFPAYARIPRKAQRKANEFIRKFQQDPKQASIHYEPIGNVVDKQLRSVRVGDDYRAIVRAPEEGNTFILLYIDHHDEAYRWAEGKQIQVHPSTGTLQFFDVDEASAAVTSLSIPQRDSAADDAAYEEKRLFSDFTDEQLFVGGVPQMLIPAVRALYTDSDLDQLVEHLPREASDLLTGLASGYEYDTVLQSILDAPVPAPVPIPPTIDPVPQALSVVVKPAATQPEVEGDAPTAIELSLRKVSTQAQFRLIDEDFDLDKALSHPLDAWRVYLHPSQRKIVQARTKGPLRITGGAGTGKTVVAMHRAAWLLKNVFTGPDDRILVTTFTKNLAIDIRNNLEKLLEPEDLTRVEVTNIDAWAAEYLRAQGHPMRPAAKKDSEEAWHGAFDLYGVDGYDLNFCKAEWDAVVQSQGLGDEKSYVRAVRHHRGIPLARAERRKLWEVFSEYRNALNESGVAENIDIVRAARRRLEEQQEAPRYCSVIVDETQDLSNESLRLIRAVAGPERANDLLLVGDAHQRIYGRPAPLSQCGINIRGRRSRELRLNYRTTAAICRWSLRTLGSAEYDDLDGGRSNTRGYVSLRKGAAPAVRHFQNNAEERAFVVETIQELLKSGVLPEEICVVARTKNFLSGGYGPAFETAGIDYEILEQKEPRSSSVRLATMHRVKGLEFPIVFVGAVNDGIVPLSTNDLKSEDSLVAAQAELQERCLLYVATSRARDRLFVTSYDTRSPFLDGLEVIEASDHGGAQSERKLSSPPAQHEAAGAGALQRTADATSKDLEKAPSKLSSEVGSVPLSSWRLPTRMTNWLSRNRVTTVADLIAINRQDLLKAKNLGRKSVGETAALIERKLGASWDELRTGGVEAGDFDSMVPVAPEMGAVLEEPLESMGLPVRFFTWANQHEVVTLRDLASRAPLELYEARNMGRGTVAHARSVVESKLGRRWEEVQRQLAAGQVADVDPQWEQLITEVPDAVAGMSLSTVPLPRAMRNYALERGHQTIGALIGVGEEVLLAEATLGRSVIAVSSNAILNYSAVARERLSRWEQGFLPALKAMFLELDTIPRMILSRRAGLGSPAETLEEIGATLGVTRERVRQIEKKTWEGIQKSKNWCEFVESKSEKIAPGGAVSLEVLEEHEWWSALASEPEAMDYFCDRLLDGRWRVVKQESLQFLATIHQKDLDAARAATKRAARTLNFPLPYVEARELVLVAAGQKSPAVIEILWQEVDEQLSTDGEGGARRAVAYGSTKYAQIIAYLERRDEPVSIHEVFAETGRVGNFPEDVFMLARGVVGLERHFPDYQEWKKRLVPVVIRLIEENGPERQWSCTDLIPTLREEIDLPDWLEHWHLAAILRRSEGVDYLGRLRVALPGVIEDSARIFVHEATEELIKEAGEPVSWDEIVAQLRRKLDVSDIALVGILNKAPFIKVAKKYYGLVTRDLPGGLEAMAEALDELEGVLERRQRGLAAQLVQKEIAKLSSVHSQWTEEMCMSIVRGDPRFRNAIAGIGVGLSDWETVRIPSRLDLIREAMEKSPGRVSVEAVSARVEAVHGVAPSRIQIGALANRFGGRLDGEWVVRGDEGEIYQSSEDRL